MTDLTIPATTVPIDSRPLDHEEASKSASETPPSEQAHSASSHPDTAATPTDPRISPAEPSVSDEVAQPSHPLDKYVKGYPKMAARMGLIPETAMFRRFGTLNARNLLYFQNELAEIEDNLQEQDLEDARSDVGKKKMYAQDFYWLNNATEERDGDVKQRVLVKRLRETLKEYNHALLQQHNILKMSAPDAYDITNMQRFMCSDLMNYNNVLFGCDMDTYGTILEENSHSKELVVLRGREAPDAFSRLASSISVPVVKKLGLPSWKKIDPAYGAITVRDATVLNLTFWTTSIIASALPVLSLVMLAKLEVLNARLGMMAVSNALLSVFLLLCTEAKRTDVFAITATFTVVQVVFVGQVLGT